ncbi:hypothetical protein L345_15485, partial [Ophiophagus hannah]
MNYCLFFFFLIAMPKWSLAEIQLVSSGPGTVRPGQNLNLLCKVTGVSITSSSYAWNWVQLVSSGPGTIRPGQNLNLLCKVTGVSITDSSYTWQWICQPPGKGLEWIGSIYPYDGTKLFSSSLQSRTTIASDSSKNEYSLQLNSMSAADTARCTLIDPVCSSEQKQETDSDREFLFHSADQCSE